MSGAPSPILIVHPELATRQAIEQSLRRVLTGPAAISQAASASQGLLLARSLDPQLVLLDLTSERGLALEVVRELRGVGRRVLGLFNPLLDREDEAEFFRAATRSGCADFLALPVADAELAEALAAAPPARDAAAPPAVGRVLTLVSHKGGVGKTTLAVNLALGLRELGQGREVVLLDAVLRLGNAAAFVGLATDRDLANLVHDLGRLGAFPAYLSAHSSGLLVLAAPRDPLQAEAISPEQLGRVLLELRRRFPLVVVDAGAQLDAAALSVLDLSDLVGVVVEAITPALVGTATYLDLLAAQGLGPERVRLIVNRFSEGEANLGLPAVERLIGRRVDHVLPYDRAADAAARNGTPLWFGRGRSELQRALRQLAEGLAGPLFGG